MLPSARPLTTSWPMRELESAFLDRADEFRRLSLVAVDSERMREIARRVGLVGNQHALPVLGGGERVTDRGLVAADLLDDRFEHVDGVVIGDGEVVGRHLVFVLYALGPVEDFGIARCLRNHAADR